MSELKRNLATNFRRYTDGRNKIEYIVKIAMYTALSFVLYAFVKFPLPFAFPGFLDIQISELPALIAGFSMGPVSGCLVIVLKCLLKFPLSTTQFVAYLQLQKEQKNRGDRACRGVDYRNSCGDNRQQIHIHTILRYGYVRRQLRAHNKYA